MRTAPCKRTRQATTCAWHYLSARAKPTPSIRHITGRDPARWSRSAVAPMLLEQFLGVRTGLGRDCGAGEHARELVDARCAAQRCELARGVVAAACLRDAKVPIGVRRHLGKMRDT